MKKNLALNFSISTSKIRCDRLSISRQLGGLDGQEPQRLYTRCFAFAHKGFALPGMSIATSRHEPPRYNQAGHGNDQAGTAISRPEMTKPGTGMVFDMIRPEGMSHPEGTAMQTNPGTDMISDMIRPEGMSFPVGTAMQIKQDTDMICDMIRP
jgi:hypothetical protein